MSSSDSKSQDPQHSSDKQSASQAFLDSQQYARKSVEKYERIFGKDFVSTGGVTTTSHFCDLIFNGLSNKYGGNNEGPYKVLDIGCGIGGSAFYMARKYNIESIHGIDLSTNMINIANEKVAAYKKEQSKENESDEKNSNNKWADKVTFEIADALKLDYKENTFDVIYSRDTILHIFEKSALFSLFFKWLKPNGVLFISDYCCGDPASHSVAFKEYVAKRGYHLHTPYEYGKLIGDCGFERVIIEDRTNHMISILKNEIEKFKEIKNEFIKDFSKDDYDDIYNGWKNKIDRCSKGDQRWGAFMAYKTITFDK